MNYFFFFILGLVVAYGIWQIMKRVQTQKDPSPPSPKASEDPGFINPEQVKKRKENLGQIVGWMANKEQITNDDVEKLLGVSNATAERYLDELEKQGTIVQIGKTGQSVHYKLK